MLPTKERLTKEKDIQLVIKKGFRRKGHFFIIYVLKNNKDNHRIACVVGKKVSKSSVVRHRYQRWLREALKSLKSEIIVPSDIVVIALPSIAKALKLQDVILDIKDVL